MNYFLFILSLVFFISCKKEKGEQLPEKTARGAYTFGCMIDNDVYAARDRCSYSFGLNLQTQCVSGSISYYGHPLLIIDTRNDFFTKDQNARIHIQLQLDSSETKLVKIIKANLEILNSQGYNHYTLDTLQNNAFTIDDAMNRNVLYGTFTLYLKSNNGQMKVLRDGRFDIKKQL